MREHATHPGFVWCFLAVAQTKVAQKKKTSSSRAVKKTEQVAESSKAGRARSRNVNTATAEEAELSESSELIDSGAYRTRLSLTTVLTCVLY